MDTLVRMGLIFTMVAVAFFWPAIPARAGSGPARVDPPGPYGPVPTPGQLAWHEMEFTAFIHFNMNTFTDYEWGYGSESPDQFHPTELDCRQWARICKAAGMKAIILTAKHHDGFCLWPSKFTEHSVKNSAWKNGKGDVVRELSEACREQGLKFGIYISPWDRHEPTYGDSPRYNDYFRNQLTELLSNYGKVAEVWWDGACGEGPNGKRQVYDWNSYKEVVRKLQPDAVIFAPPDIVPDLRWVGNERGYAEPTNWCRLHEGKIETEQVLRHELGRGHRNGDYWMPAECDVSIRPGWYYHADQDERVKSLDELLEIYYGSVGRGSVLLLNLPVDRRGLVHENDEARLMELKRVLDLTFDENLAAGAEVIASNTRGNAPRFNPSRVVDNDRKTYWATDDDVTTATLEFHLAEPILFNRVMIQEAIELGQRVEAFEIEVLESRWLTRQPDSAWSKLAEGTTIGYKRLLRTRPVYTDRIRLKIIKALACPAIASFGLFVSPPKVVIEPETIGFMSKDLEVRVQSDIPGAAIHYTLDGKKPTRGSPRYDKPIRLKRTATIKARAWLGDKPGITDVQKTYERFDPASLPDPIDLSRGEVKPGLAYTYYEGGWQSLRDLPAARIEAKGFVKTFTLDVRKRDEHFALQFMGFVEILEDGIYSFYTVSDDGSMLYVGHQKVVSNDYLQGMTERTGQIALKAGYHPINVQYFNATGGMGLEVYYEGPGMVRQQVPTVVLK